jgi:hypothetical protein
MDVDRGSIGDNDDEAIDPRRQETPHPLEDETESEEDKDVEFNLPSSHSKEDRSALSNRPGLVTLHLREGCLLRGRLITTGPSSLG